MIRRSRAGSNATRLTERDFMASPVVVVTSSRRRRFTRSTRRPTRIAYIRDLCDAGVFPEMEVGEIPVAYGGHMKRDR